MQHVNRSFSCYVIAAILEDDNNLLLVHPTWPLSFDSLGIHCKPSIVGGGEELREILKKFQSRLMVLTRRFILGSVFEAYSMKMQKTFLTDAGTQNRK